MPHAPPATGTRHRAQALQMLDRLVRGAVLAEADRIVGHDIDDARALQRAQANGGPRIIGEDEERAAVGDYAAMQRHSVHRRRHAELADAVIDITPRVIFGGQGLERLGLGIVRSGEVGGTANRRGNRRVDRLQRHFRGLARRDWLLIRDEPVEIGLEPGIIDLA